MTPDGHKLYMTGYDGEISVIDPRTLRSSKTIHTVYPITEIAFAPDSGKAYAAMYDRVSIIDTVTDSMTSTVALSAGRRIDNALV